MDKDETKILYNHNVKYSPVRGAVVTVLYSLAVLASIACLLLALFGCSVVRVPENIEATRDGVEALKIDVRGIADEVVKSPAIKAEMLSARKAEQERKDSRKQGDNQTLNWLLSLLSSYGIEGSLAASLVALGLKYFQQKQTDKKLQVAYECVEVSKNKALELGADKKDLRNDLVLVAQKAGVHKQIASDLEKREAKK